MSNRRTRDRHLAKLAARRQAERRRKRRQRALATAVAITVAVAGLAVGAKLVFFGKKAKAAAKPTPSHSVTPTPSATSSPSPTGSPGSNCGYVANTENSGSKGKQPIPPFKIDVNKTYTATMVTTLGTIEVALLPKDAPCTVNSFVYLADRHFYDGLKFHRIVTNFVDQGGDPTGTGSGGPGYKFNDELANSLTYAPGTLAMANSGPNTNGSQFFIVVSQNGAAQLSHLYTIFGTVTKGMDVVTKINSEAGASSGTPTKTVTITKITIKES